MTPTTSFPPLALVDWLPTRDAIHAYAQALGKIRAALTPRQRYWWHISLHVTETGLATPPIPLAPDGSTLVLRLDLRQHRLEIDLPAHPSKTLPLAAPWSSRGFLGQALDMLAAAGVDANIDRAGFGQETPLSYDPIAAERFGASLRLVDAVFKRFQAELPGETSPVQLWPHHFDLALTWFTGRKVPGFDATDEEWADEQMGFGFVTGDAGFPDAYFYVTAYPWPPALAAAPLRRPARWVHRGWKGALLPYAALGKRKHPAAYLFDFLAGVQQMAAKAMTPMPEETERSG
jgi:hypothetical protein